jgi:hypothetical protein
MGTVPYSRLLVSEAAAVDTAVTAILAYDAICAAAARGEPFDHEAAARWRKILDRALKTLKLDPDALAARRAQEQQMRFEADLAERRRRAQEEAMERNRQYEAHKVELAEKAGAEQTATAEQQAADRERRQRERQAAEAAARAAREATEREAEQERLRAAEQEAAARRALEQAEQQAFDAWMAERARMLPSQRRIIAAKVDALLAAEAAELRRDESRAADMQRQEAARAASAANEKRYQEALGLPPFEAPWWKI